MKIGMFDSGIGGLTVLKEFIKKYPNNHYIYYGDTKNLPYGTKDKEELFKLVKPIISFFAKQKVDFIIIACGTISANCFFELKKMTTIPIYDIITPTINYLNHNNYKSLAIFATNRTIDSHIFKDKLIAKDVLEIKTPEFVPMIENNKLDLSIIKNYCSQVLNYDILILGCTHYPLLINELTKYLSIPILNMAIPLLNSIEISNDTNFKLELYFTKIDTNLINNIQKIIKESYIIKEI